MSRMKKLFIFMMMILMWSEARAYRLTEDFNNGFYWASLPVQFMVMDTNPTRLQLIKQLTVEAVSEWENALEDALINQLWNVSSQQGSPSSNRNIIRWSTRFGAETGLSESTTLAVAIRYTSGPYVARAEIIINGNHPINSFPEQLKTVLVHELGHTLGLDHSDVRDAVMAPSLVLDYQGLHWDDEEGMTYTVTETKRRQAIGYISPLAAKSEESSGSALSCGTVDISGGGGDGGGSPMLSLGLGLLLALTVFGSRFKNRLI
jgi:hypothetical protein